MTESIPRLSCLFAYSLTSAFLLLAYPCASEPHPHPLLPDISIERPLADGGVDLFTAELTPGAWRVEVEHFGIDVLLEARLIEAHDSDGQSLAGADLPLGRFGRETLLLENENSTRVEIAVRPAETGVAAGRYRLTLERLAVSPRQLAAERAMSDAAVAAARREREALREAVARLEEAAVIWHQLGNERRAAEAVQARAFVHGRLGEASLAAELFDEALAAWRRLGEPRLAALALNHRGLSLRELDRDGEAWAHFEEAARLYRELGEPHLEAAAHNNKGLMHLKHGELEAAAESFQTSLELLRGAPDSRLADQLNNNLGGLYSRLGEPAAARRHLEKALTFRRQTGDRHREAATLTNLASLDRFTGHWQDALEGWNRALEIYRELGDRRNEALVRNSLGAAHLRLGELERARAFLLEALPLRRATKNRRGEAITLNHLATVYHRLGGGPAASAARQKALELRRELGDRQGEARVLVWLGHDALDLGDARSALEHYVAASGIFESPEVDDPRNAVHAAAGRGRALAALERTDAASEALEAALVEHQRLGDGHGEITTRVALVTLERRRGRLEEALGHAERAIALIEGLRGEIPGPGLRAAFFSSRRRAHEERIDLLVSLAERKADPTRLRRALSAAEHARARSLLDLLADSRIDPQRGVDPDLRTRRRALLDRLHLRAGRGLPAAAELTQLDLLEAEIRRRHPVYAGITRPEPLDADGIAELLDPDTTLLQYALGDERSFLWRVTRTELEVHALPPRAEIEGLARRVHGEWATLEVGAERDSESAASKLAAVVLGPVASGWEASAEERLVIVADGALAYVPFAALPWPESPDRPGEPLLARFEIVSLPSVSALAALRRPKRAAPRRAAVVLADPIFHPADPRLAGLVSGTTFDGPRYDRLPASRGEAETLLDLLPAGEVSAVLDAAANRDAVLGGALSGARVVHLATHGMIDAVRPELSGLMLSRLDAAGQPRDGFLGLRDVYELELLADLVVLSGCRTALGKEVRGEGLVGLVHGFFYSGTPRVIASLWRVEDRATALLMEHFYRALFTDGRRPAAALRQAQLAVRAERRFRHPSFWAGFVLQGDWR